MLCVYLVPALLVLGLVSGNPLEGNKTLDKILAELEKTNTELEKLTAQVGLLTESMSAMPSICTRAACTNYTTLSDSWRHIQYENRKSYKYSIKYTDRVGKNDNYFTYTQLTKKWYRFSGEAGRRLPTAPARGGPPDSSGMQRLICATSGTGYILSGGNPTLQDGIVTRVVCFEIKNDRNRECFEKKTINMAACQDQDKKETYFVYELEPVDEYRVAYCAID